MRKDFFDSVCVFDYRGYCKNDGDCLKKTFSGNMQKQKLSGRIMSKTTPLKMHLLQYLWRL